MNANVKCNICDRTATWQNFAFTPAGEISATCDEHFSIGCDHPYCKQFAEYDKNGNRLTSCFNTSWKYNQLGWSYGKCRINPVKDNN